MCTSVLSGKKGQYSVHIFTIKNSQRKPTEINKSGVIHRENLSKPMNGKDMGIPIYFPWVEKKYFHTLGNLCKLVSHAKKISGILIMVQQNRKQKCENHKDGGCYQGFWPMALQD